MRIVEELSSFYRHIYLNLPGFTRLVGVPTSELEPISCSLQLINHV